MELHTNYEQTIIKELNRLNLIKQALAGGYRRSLILGVFFVAVTAWFFSQFVMDLWMDMQQSAVVHFLLLLSAMASTLGGLYYAHRYRFNLQLVNDLIEVIDQVVSTHG